MKKLLYWVWSMNSETQHEWSTSAVQEVWQTAEKKRLWLIMINLNTILCWLLL